MLFLVQGPVGDGEKVEREILALTFDHLVRTCVRCRGHRLTMHFGLPLELPVESCIISPCLFARPSILFPTPRSVCPVISAPGLTHAILKLTSQMRMPNSAGVRQPPLPYLTASQSSVLPRTGTGPIYPYNLAHPLFKWTCTPNETRDTVRLDMYE